MPESEMTTPKTLAQRIAEEHLQVSEALRYAMQVGESLRKLHDAGHAHGAVMPANIYMTGAGAELMTGCENPADAVTPYTAPELLQGRPADARSDIFSFGAVLFEMLTGKPAFEGDGRTTLAANLNGAPTPSSGSPAADRLIGPCLAKNPDARTPRMQKILMELKLLSVAARRAEAAAAATKREPPVEPRVMRAELDALESRLAGRLAAHEQHVIEMQRGALEAVSARTEEMRTEVGQAEARIASRMAEYEEGVAGIQRSAVDAVSTLKEQLAALVAGVTAVQNDLASRPTEAELSERILSRVDQGFEAVGEHVGRLEKTLEDLRTHSAQFERSVAADLVDIEQNLKVHTTAIESARTAMSQTDDLVERVVEALESLQTAVLDQTEAAPAEQAAFAVN